MPARNARIPSVGKAQIRPIRLPAYLVMNLRPGLRESSRHQPIRSRAARIRHRRQEIPAVHLRMAPRAHRIRRLHRLLPNDLGPREQREEDAHPKDKHAHTIKPASQLGW